MTREEMALSIYRYRIGLPPRDEAEARRFEVFSAEGRHLVTRMDLLAETPLQIEEIPDHFPKDWT